MLETCDLCTLIQQNVLSHMKNNESHNFKYQVVMTTIR